MLFVIDIPMHLVSKVSQCIAKTGGWGQSGFHLCGIVLAIFRYTRTCDLDVTGTAPGLPSDMKEAPKDDRREIRLWSCHTSWQE